MDSGKKYLTPAELVARFENTVTVKTLAHWRCQGVGPTFTKIGAKVLYAVPDVESYEAASRSRAEQKAAARAAQVAEPRPRGRKKKR